MGKTLNYLAALLMTISPLSENFIENSKGNDLESKIEWFIPEKYKKIEWDTIQIKNYKIPHLNKKFSNLDDEKCSGYCTRVALNEYGKNYYWRTSEDRIYWDKIISKMDKNKQKENWSKLDTLAMEGKLKPGMIVGFFYEGSKYKNGKDEKENPNLATHTAIYRGAQLNKNGEIELVFDDQWGGKERRITSKDEWVSKMKEKIYPTYVVDFPDELNKNLDLKK